MAATQQSEPMPALDAAPVQAQAPAAAPIAPRARIVVRPDSGPNTGAQAIAAAVPPLVQNTLPPHDWEAIEQRRKLAQRRSTETGKRLHALEGRRQAHVESLKKELLRAEAIETPLQPTFFTPPKSRGAGEQRRSSFVERLSPPKEHLHRRSLSREQQQAQIDLRGCTFQPVIFSRPQRAQQKRGTSAPPKAKRTPAEGSGHKEDDTGSVSSLSSGSVSSGPANGTRAASGGPNVFERSHEYAQIYQSRREILRQELHKAEQESLPFAPKMLSRASSPGPQSAPAAPSNPADRDAFFERIKLRLHALEERKHKAKGEWELRGCSFTPHINRSTRQQHTAGGLPFHERLYNDAHARRLSLEELKRRVEKEELRECTWDPFAFKDTANDPVSQNKKASPVLVASPGGPSTTVRQRQRSSSTPVAPLRPTSPMTAMATAAAAAAATTTTTMTAATRKTISIEELFGTTSGSGSRAAIVIKGGAAALIKPPATVVEAAEEDEDEEEQEKPLLESY